MLTNEAKDRFSAAGFDPEKIIVILSQIIALGPTIVGDIEKIIAIFKPPVPSSAP